MRAKASQGAMTLVFCCLSASELRAQPNTLVGGVVDPQPGRLFSDRGQLVLSSDAGLSASHTAVQDADESHTFVNVLIQPAADFFVVDRLSIGGLFQIRYRSDPAEDSSDFAMGARLGYNVPFSSRVSLWPRLGAAFARRFESPIGSRGEADYVFLSLFAPLLFHPVEHFFVGLGPSLSHEFISEYPATTLAAHLTLGGWL
jgi:hypothetical protein